MLSLPCRTSVVADCAVLGLVSGGCGTTETKSTPDGKSGSSQNGDSATAASEEAQSEPKPRVARVGDSLTLEGSDGLERA
jgi:hypothetical protein